MRMLTVMAMLGLVGLMGCQQAAAPGTSGATPAADSSATAATEAPSTEATTETAFPRKRSLKPVQLGGAVSTDTVVQPQNSDDPDAVMAALRPLQILLGKWNGTSRKAHVDQPEWVWDLQTDRRRPALVMSSEKGTYLRSGRLTFDPRDKSFAFTLTSPEGTTRQLTGTLVEPVQDVPGDDKKLQRTFKLLLTETAPQEGERWQVAFHQQENNRYIVELDRKRGSGPFQRIDTIHTQREGTSFALSETDYGDRTCIISQGLGTMTVSYKGQTYYVCCTGCKAAFEEEPERWIAKWEERKKTTPQ